MTCRGHCAVIRGYINSEIEDIKNYRLMLLLLLLNSHSWLDQESNGYGLYLS